MNRKAYTAKGDDGFTADYAGRRLAKDDIVIIVGGKIDALQTVLDLAMLKGSTEHREFLAWIQKKLWQTAGEISCADEKCVVDPISASDLEKLERYIDSLGEPPQRFVRFDTEGAIVWNEARVRCRELETFLVKLLRDGKVRPVVYAWCNRLSSLFFMLGCRASESA